MLIVDFTYTARQDMDEVFNYLLVRNPLAAVNIVDEIESTIYQSLAFFPHMGTPRNEYEDGLRMFPVEEYVIYYRVTSVLEIIRILHHKRDRDHLFQ